MTTRDERVHRITDRAYEFARSGAFENIASLERKLMQEGKRPFSAGFFSAW